MNRLVWRVEQVGGGGLYRNGAVDFGDLLAKHKMGSSISSFERPTPTSDKLLCDKWIKIENAYKEHEWSFCFSSIQQLKDWTGNPKIRAAMEEKMFIVRVFSVDPKHIAKGSKQAIFRKDRAKKIAEFTPMELDVVTDIREYNADLFDTWSVVLPS